MAMPVDVYNYTALRESITDTDFLLIYFYTSQMMATVRLYLPAVSIPSSPGCEEIRPPEQQGDMDFGATTRSLSCSDTLTVSDTARASASIRGITASNTMSISEAVNVLIGASGILSVAVSDTAVISDTAIVAAILTVILNAPANASSTEDTTPTFNFTGAGETHNLEYNFELDSVNTFDSNIYDTVSYLTDSFVHTGPYDVLGNGTAERVFQSFYNDRKHKLTYATVTGYKSGNPTGNMTAVIYAHSGTYGGYSEPTGAALATSGNVDVSTLSTGEAKITFIFSSGYILEPDTHYCVSFEYNGGNGANYVRLVMNNAGGHGGNSGKYQSGAWSSNTHDLSFGVGGKPLLFPIIKFSNSTDTGFTAGHPYAPSTPIDYTVDYYQDAPNVTYRAGSRTTFGMVSAVTVTEPTGTVQDDIMIAAIYIRDSAAVITTPNGWTFIDKIDADTNHTVSIYWARRGASAPSLIFDLDSSWNAEGSVITYYNCYALGSPVDVTVSKNSATSGTAMTCSSITTNTNRSMIIGIVSSYTLQSYSSSDFTNERQDGGATHSIAIYDDNLLVTAGSTGNMVVTAGSSESWAAFLIALRPADITHLPDAIRYYWRVRAIAPTGNNVYSAWSEIRNLMVVTTPLITATDTTVIGESVSVVVS